jgi:hypothetical protein
MARLWDAASGKLLATLSGHTDTINSAVFSPDGARVVTASPDGTARVWEAASGKLLATLSGHTSDVSSEAFSPDGARVVTASPDGTARVWEAASGKLLATLSGRWDGVAFSPDGARVMTVDGFSVRVWDAASGSELAAIEQTDHWRSAAFSPDGTRIVIASEDQTARVWEAASGKLLATLSGHTDTVNSAVFSPDGARVVTASDDGTARLWDATSGKLLATLSGHTNWVSSAAFSPDGERVVTVSDDGTARIWDTEHRLELLVIFRGASGVRFAAFDADGSHLLTARADGLLQRWQLWPSRQALLEYARSVCGTCEPNYEQRVEFRIYNWPMLVFEYRQILIAFWLGLFYLICGWVVYRSMFARSARAVPVRNPGFSWKRFATAGAQGGLAVALALTGILMILLIELFYFGKEARGGRGDTPSELIVQAIFVLPIGLWAGGAYNHFTGAQVGRRARRKCMLLGGLAGLAGAFLLTLLAGAIVLFWQSRIIPPLQIETSTDWLADILIPPLVVGIAGGIMSAIGAALYIFALQPLALRWATHADEEE